MTVICDNKKRVTLPAKPGSRFDLQAIGEDQFVLTRLEPVEPKRARVTFTKVNGRTVASTGKMVSLETIQKALAEFP